MSRRKNFLIAGMAIILAAALAVVAAASPQKTRARLQQRSLLAGMFQAGQFVKGLDLTPDQKTKIKDILASHKADIKAAIRGVAEARLSLGKALDNGNTKINDLASNLTAAQVYAFQLRSNIFSEIKPILTPDQLAKIEQMKQRREERLQKLLNRIGG